MLAVAIICWLVGMVLAHYQRIFALAPLALASCVLAGMIGAAQGHSIQSIILTCLVIVVCLQLGFLVGALIAVPDDNSLPFRKLRRNDSPVVQPANHTDGRERADASPVLKGGAES